MYIVAKFSESWSVLDAETGHSQNLEASKAAILTQLFPRFLQDTDQLICAVSVTELPASKLAHLSASGKTIRKK